MTHAAQPAKGLALVPALLGLVKFAHTVFALPFALAGALLARMEIPAAARIGWILLAMAGARSLAMALNRLIDMPLGSISGSAACPWPRWRTHKPARRLHPAGRLAAA